MKTKLILLLALLTLAFGSCKKETYDWQTKIIMTVMPIERMNTTCPAYEFKIVHDINNMNIDERYNYDASRTYEGWMQIDSINMRNILDIYNNRDFFIKANVRDTGNYYITIKTNSLEYHCL
jgi:hypothetical protein